MDTRSPAPDDQASYAADMGAPEKLTPMMAQFMEIKAANPDSLLFYRMGDFYELFFDDAEIASRTLGIVLTKRGKHLGEDIPMCGVPVVRADDYLQKLIGAGHRVAVCEQMEDPAEAKKRGAKSVVRRDVVRLVTPGTITEEMLLEPGRANRFLAIARRRSGDHDAVYGWAAIDISTGSVVTGEADRLTLAIELARLDPSEIILPDAVRDDPALAGLWDGLATPLTVMANEGLDQNSATRRVQDAYGVATLDAFGAFTPAEIAAAGMALAYVERTQISQRPSLTPPRRETSSGTMRIDAATRANLEITRTLAGTRAGSLLDTVDRTLTPAGGRLICEWLTGPLATIEPILKRQAGIAFLVQAGPLRDELRSLLKAVPDVARALSRLALDRGGPRDLAAMAQGVMLASEAAAALSASGPLPPLLAEAADTLAAAPVNLARSIAEAMVDEPPLQKRDGGFVRTGFSDDLDELRALQTDSRRFIAALQGQYALETGCKTLRIKHNNVLGYFIEVPQANGEDLVSARWSGTFVHRQTMAGAMRFTTVELGGLEARIVSAADQALKQELRVHERLRNETLAAASAIQSVAEALALIDVAAALAELASLSKWVRPVVEDSMAFTITGGRHPAVEAALLRKGADFIANDAELSPLAGQCEAGRILLLTGPNMAGKSTYLRQNALIAILAQIGSYVPVTAARIGLVDQLFSRVGASDDLARGRSTFMVEMVETAAILNLAGPRALVILDEIGRGTATFDGLSIAWATLEHLHEVNRSRALFATHFHELTALAARWPRMQNATVKVREWNGDVVFLHEVVAGAADRSYGIQVGKLAGLPPAVVARAKAILGELERGELERPKAQIIDDLPLFSVAVTQGKAAASGPDPLHEALARINPDELTAREALDALYSLKKIADG
jgi:DNA mismatch repair protein MutS